MGSAKVQRGEGRGRWETPRRERQLRARVADGRLELLLWFCQAMGVGVGGNHSDWHFLQGFTGTLGSRTLIRVWVMGILTGGLTPCGVWH